MNKEKSLGLFSDINPSNDLEPQGPSANWSSGSSEGLFNEYNETPEDTMRVVRTIEEMLKGSSPTV